MRIKKIRIPRKIHYCWFGEKEISGQCQQYIRTWKTHNPNYDIVLWNEENSPMQLAYMRTAYENRNWANLSNYTRLHALYQEGGIYLDTDIEVLRGFDSLLDNACFLGFEQGSERDDKFSVNNAVLGSIPGHPFIRKCMTFLLNAFDGTERAPDSSPAMTTNLLKELGLRSYGNQLVENIRVYPVEYFFPFPYKKEAPSRITDNTYTVHHWAASWKGEKKSLPEHRVIQNKVRALIRSMARSISRNTY